MGLGAEQHHGQVFQKDAHGQGRNQGGHRAGLAHRAVSQNLDQHADHGTDRNGDDDRQPGGHTRVDHKRDGIKQCVGTDHDKITMGEVDHADDAVNHCVAQGNQCVDRALVQTVYQTLKKQ